MMTDVKLVFYLETCDEARLKLSETKQVVIKLNNIDHADIKSARADLEAIKIKTEGRRGKFDPSSKGLMPELIDVSMTDDEKKQYVEAFGRELEATRPISEICNAVGRSVTRFIQAAVEENLEKLLELNGGKKVIDEDR